MLSILRKIPLPVFISPNNKFIGSNKISKRRHIRNKEARQLLDINWIQNLTRPEPIFRVRIAGSYVVWPWLVNMFYEHVEDDDSEISPIPVTLQQ